MTVTDALSRHTGAHFAYVADKSLFRDTPYTTEYSTRGGKRVMTLKDVPLFRSGSFRDSMGEPHTYDEFHIEGFVRNFDYLKDSKILEYIPARKGHRGGGLFGGKDPIEGVVGWVRSLRTEKRTAPHDGQEYTYLLGNVDILDHEAQEKIDAGLWPNRSAEVGVHVDNNGAETAPAFLGFAFVDMSAVEGLNFNLQNDQNILLTEEDTNMDPVLPPTGANANTVVKFTCGGNELVSPEKVQEYISNLEGENASFTAQLAAKDAEIKSLKDFQDTIIADTRKEYVNSLVDTGRLLATQKDDQLALVEMFSQEQFDKYKSAMDKAPANPLLAQHGNQDSIDPVNGGDADAFAKALENDKKTLRNLKAVGKSLEVIQKSGAFERVSKAEPNFSLETFLK